MGKQLTETVRGLLEMEFDVQECTQVLMHNRSIFWSWGPTNFMSMDSKGLLFLAHARRHNGYVLITLSPDDWYTVHIISTHGNVLETFKDICFEELVETIDSRI